MRLNSFWSWCSVLLHIFIAGTFASVDLGASNDGLSMNFTLQVPHGAVTFRGGYVVARSYDEPTVWTMVLDEATSTVQIKTIDPFGRTFYWQDAHKDRNRLPVGPSAGARLDVRVQSSFPDSRMVFMINGKCVHFNPEAVALLTDNSDCTPVAFTKVKPVAWVKLSATAPPDSGFDTVKSRFQQAMDSVGTLLG